MRLNDHGSWTKSKINGHVINAVGSIIKIDNETYPKVPDVSF